MTLASASQSPAKAPKGCWTCKGALCWRLLSHGIRLTSSRNPARKVGCDRGLPGCDNCLRTERHCGGYGLRLQWHEKPDGRRKHALRVPESFTRYHTAYEAGSARHFISYTFDDLTALDNGQIDLKVL